MCWERTEGKIGKVDLSVTADQLVRGTRLPRQTPQEPH